MQIGLWKETILTVYDAVYDYFRTLATVHHLPYLVSEIWYKIITELHGLNDLYLISENVNFAYLQLL